MTMNFLEFKNRRKNIIDSLCDTSRVWNNCIDILSESDWNRCFWLNTIDLHEIYETDTIGETICERVIIEDILSIGSDEQIFYCLNNKTAFNSIIQQRWYEYYGSFYYFNDDSVRMTMVIIFLWLEIRFLTCDSIIDRYFILGDPIIDWTFKGILCNSRDVIDAEWSYRHLKNLNVVYCDRTPLINSSANCDSTLTKFLLTNGADPNYCDKDGESTLLNAVSKRCESVVQLLLSAGADPFITNNLKQSPVSMAKEIGDENIISIFEYFGY